MCYLWWKKVKNRKIHNKSAEKLKMKMPAPQDTGIFPLIGINHLVLVASYYNSDSINIQF